MEAMKQPGYISGETLFNSEDSSNIIVISTWNSLKDWDNWCKSDKRVEMDKKLLALPAKYPKITTYRYLSYQKGIQK